MQMRFVILEHDHPVVHWDLMLDGGAALQTWRLAQAPVFDVWIDATALGDHRRAYLDYEGPVTGNRGTVKRWDAGAFEEARDSTPTIRRLLLRGGHMCGLACLEKLTGGTWRFRITSAPAP
jgi:hypothetical protein